MSGMQEAARQTGITEQDEKDLEIQKEEISSTGAHNSLHIDETGASTE